MTEAEKRLRELGWRRTMFEYSLTLSPSERCGAMRNGYTCMVHKDQHDGLRHLPAIWIDGTWYVNDELNWDKGDFFADLGL